jgi:serine/threonine protein kinase
MNESSSQLDQVIANYLIAVETDNPMDLETICQQHPNLETQIRDYFALQRGLFQSNNSDLATTAIEIDGFQLVREIGRGGAGVVFEAIETGLNRLVAIKILKLGSLESATAKKRFGDEAKLIAKLEHPCIVDVIQYGEADGRPYLVMPLLTGKSLHKFIQRGPLEQRRSARVMARITAAISVAHRHGIIHRDIKPANILTGESLENCKVTDFGLATWQDAELRFTQTGDIVGTPGFIAPEIIRGKNRGDELTDIYSLGATLYALLTGVTPFQAATPAESIVLAMNSDPVAPRKLNPNIAVDINSICLKCMNHDRAKRYQNAVGLEADLKNYLAGLPVAARPVSGLQRSARWAARNPALGTAITIAVATLVAIAGLGIYSWTTITTKNRQLETAIETQQELTNDSHESLKGSIEAIRKFFTTVGTANEFDDTAATTKLKQRLLNEGLGYLNQFLEQNAYNAALRYEVGLAQIQISKLHDLLGQSVESHQSLLSAKNTLQETLLISPQQIGAAQALTQTWSQIGAYHMFRSEFEAASVALKSAIEVAESVDDQFATEPELELAYHQARITLCRNQYRQGECDKAAAQGQRILKDIESLAIKNPNSALVQRKTAKSCQFVALFFHKRSINETALEIYRLGASYIQRALNIDPDNEIDQKLARQFDLAEVQILIFNAKQQSDAPLEKLDNIDVKDLVGTIERVAAWFRTTAEKHPGNPRKQYEYLQNVQLTVSNLNSLGQTDKSIRQLEQCIQDCNNLEVKFGANNKRFVAATKDIEIASRLALGTLLINNGKVLDGLQQKTKALAVERKLVDDHPDNSQRKHVFFEHLRDAAGFQYKNDLMGDAFETYEESLSVCRSCARSEPDAHELLALMMILGNTPSGKKIDADSGIRWPASLVVEFQSCLEHVASILGEKTSELTTPHRKLLKSVGSNSP